jgi:SAM-dependent methyltransferase
MKNKSMEQTDNWRINDLATFNDKIRKTYPAGNLIGVEIGCLAGQSAEAWMLSNNFKTLYCIDPWKNGYDSNDGSNNNAEISEKQFDMVMAIYPNIIKIKKTSMEALTDFKDGTLDFVYIDSCHTYEAVKQDIENWSKKLKMGGILSGHDYGHGCFPGIRKAVNELLVPDFVINSSWVKFNFLHMKCEHKDK